jgi:hypothetical protein
MLGVSSYKPQGVEKAGGTPYKKADPLVYYNQKTNVMTVEQLDAQMKSFLMMIESNLQSMESENFERLDISGFIDVYTDLVKALDLEAEVFQD